jgi:hypothetical protein
MVAEDARPIWPADEGTGVAVIRERQHRLRHWGVHGRAGRRTAPQAEEPATPPGALVGDASAPVHFEQWNSVDDAFLHLVSAYEALESFEASGPNEDLPISFQLAVGTVCTALVSLDDYCHNVRQPFDP